MKTSVLLRNRSEIAQCINLINSGDMTNLSNLISYDTNEVIKLIKNGN